MKKRAKLNGVPGVYDTDTQDFLPDAEAAPVEAAAPEPVQPTPSFLSYEPPAAARPAAPSVTNGQARSTVPYSQQGPHGTGQVSSGARRPNVMRPDTAVHPEEALGRAAGQSATFGLQDEASAWLADRLSEGDTYEADRDMMRRENAEARAAQPSASVAGDVLGAVPMMATGGAGILRGAAEGALAGYGYSEADDPTQDTLEGAAFGGAIPLVGEGVSNAGRGLRKVGGDLLDKAYAMHARIPGPIPEAYATRVGGPEELGRLYEGEGIANDFLAGPAQAAQDASGVLDRTGREFDAIHSSLDASGARVPVTGRQAEQLEAYIPESMARKNNAAQSARGMIENDGNGGTFRQAHDARQVLDEGIERTASPLEERSRAELRRELSDEMGRTAEAGGQGQQWQDTNARHAVGSAARGSAESGLNTLANNPASNFSREAGIAAAAAAAPVGFEAASNNGNTSMSGGGAAGLGTGLAALGAQVALRGRGPAVGRALSRGAGRTAGVAGAGLEAASTAGQAAARTQTERVARGDESGVTSLKKRFQEHPELFERFLDDRMMETLQNGDEQDAAALNYELSADPNYRRLMTMERNQ